MHQAPFIQNLAFLGRDCFYSQLRYFRNLRTGSKIVWVSFWAEIRIGKPIRPQKLKYSDDFFTKSGGSWNKVTVRNLWDGFNIRPGISDFGLIRVPWLDLRWDEWKRFFSFLSLFTRLMNFWLNEILRRL